MAYSRQLLLQQKPDLNYHAYDNYPSIFSTSLTRPQHLTQLQGKGQDTTFQGLSADVVLGNVVPRLNPNIPTPIVNMVAQFNQFHPNLLGVLQQYPILQKILMPDNQVFNRASAQSILQAHLSVIPANLLPFFSRMATTSGYYSQATIDAINAPPQVDQITQTLNQLALTGQQQPGPVPPAPPPFAPPPPPPQPAETASPPPPLTLRPSQPAGTTPPQPSAILSEDVARPTSGPDILGPEGRIPWTSALTGTSANPPQPGAQYLIPPMSHRPSATTSSVYSSGESDVSTSGEIESMATTATLPRSRRLGAESVPTARAFSHARALLDKFTADATAVPLEESPVLPGRFQPRFVGPLPPSTGILPQPISAEHLQSSTAVRARGSAAGASSQPGLTPSAPTLVSTLPLRTMTATVGTPSPPQRRDVNEVGLTAIAGPRLSSYDALSRLLSDRLTDPYIGEIIDEPMAEAIIKILASYRAEADAVRRHDIGIELGQLHSALNTDIIQARIAARRASGR